MKCCFLIFSIAIFMAIENSYSFEWTPPKWTPKEINLTSSGITEIIISGNTTEYILLIPNNNLEEQDTEGYYIYLWIETMACSVYTPNPDGSPDTNKPNYLIITDQSDNETAVNPWRICANITNTTNTEVGLHDMFLNPGVTEVKIQPLGENWSHRSTPRTVIKAERRKHKTIILGSEIDQIDININPETIYSLEITKKDEICSLHNQFDCVLMVSISKMGCYDWMDYDEYLEIVKENAGSNKTTQKFCQAVDFKNSYSNYNNFFESTNKIVLRSVGLSNVRVSITLVLSSGSHSIYCPTGYFDCNNYRETKCIREELKCDGRPNCPSDYSNDESYELCDRNYYDGSGRYSYYDGLPMFGYLCIFLLIIVGISVVIMTFRCIESLCKKPANVTRTTVPDQMSMPPPTYDVAVKLQAP